MPCAPTRSFSQGTRESIVNSIDNLFSLRKYKRRLRESRALTPIMALRLSRLFGNTAEFLLNAQRTHDLWEAQQVHQAEIKKIHPLEAA
jgi:plasmid maintenance system antidote protein VapI